jgi:hypothetical protein
MEPLEFEGRRSRKSRDRHGVPRPAAHESSLLTGPGGQPGSGHPGRGTGPHAPTRQRYPSGTAPQWPPARPAPANRSVEPYSDGNGYAYDENDRGYRRGYGNDGSYGNGYGYGEADSAGDYPPRQGTIQGTLEPRNGNSVSMAARILSVADYEAASITQQASLQAAMVTRRVAYEATGIREAAQREADDIVQRASLQAAAVREAAEIEADEVRMAVTSMQTELSELAERIRHTLPHPALPPDAPPAGRPAARPAIGPSTHPPTGPKARPRTGPGERLPGKPGARAAGKPGPRAAGKPGTQGGQRPTSGQGRQGAAMRFAVIATAALFLVAVAAGVMEIHLHGWKFFIFRSVGTGETGRGPGGLQENQGPGQPDAPKTTPSQTNVQPSPRSTVTVHSGN